MESEDINLQTQYDESLQKINQLNALLSKLANKESLEDLADQTTSEEYLELLANLIYSLHSTMYSYCHVRGQEMPEEFKKVKEYYSKVKDTLAGKEIKKDKNPLQVDRQAAKRLIKAGVKQDSTGQI